MAFSCKPLFLISLISCFSTICLPFSYNEASNDGRGVTVDLIHRDSPLSPFYDPSMSRFQRLRKSFNRSFARHSYINRYSNKIMSPLSSSGGEYLMEIGIGTPPVQVSAIADTGSDLTWTQCLPCTDCYNQTATLFDPTKTSSYRSVSCTSSQCQALGSGAGTCDKSNGCLYQVSYGDSSYSDGNLAVETFTFSSSDSHNSTAFPKVVFGCGHSNQGTFDARASGIIGLGGGALSIVQQLDKSVGGKFSYCLTPVGSNATSKISFGSSATVSGPRVSTTPLLKKSIDTFYYITLNAVSVGETRLPYKFIPTQPREEGNIIVDSGTTLTFLPTDLYNRLEAAMVKAVKGKRVPDPQGALNLCYEIPGNGKLASPPVMAHFSGSDVAVPQESVFVEVEKGVACLTFAASDGLGIAIYGNLHQINYLIGYDLVNKKINFLPTDCSKQH